MAERAEPTRIGVRELRSKLAYHLLEARKGRRFLILSRGEPMAELGPPPMAPADERPGERDVKDALAFLREEVRADFRAGDRLSRDEAHDRRS